MKKMCAENDQFVKMNDSEGQSSGSHSAKGSAKKSKYPPYWNKMKEKK